MQVLGAFNKEQAVVSLSFAISMDVVKFREVLLTALLFSNERIIVYTFLQFSFSKPRLFNSIRDKYGISYSQ